MCRDYNSLLSYLYIFTKIKQFQENRHIYSHVIENSALQWLGIQNIPDLEHTQTPKQNLPLYCNSLRTQGKYKQQTDKFKLLFPSLSQQIGKRWSTPQKQNFYLNNALLFRETAGYSFAPILPMMLRSTTEGRSPWAHTVHCALMVCHQMLNTALPFSFQSEAGA